MAADTWFTLYKYMVRPILTKCGILHLNKKQTLISKSNNLHEQVRRIITSHKSSNIKSTESNILSKALMTVRICIEEDKQPFQWLFWNKSTHKIHQKQWHIIKTTKREARILSRLFLLRWKNLYNKLSHEIRTLDKFDFYTENWDTYLI